MEAPPIDVTTCSSPQSRRTFPPRTRFLIAGLVLAGALGYLIYVGLHGASIYYLSVSDLATRGEAAYDNEVRLSGKVIEGSLRQDASTRAAYFVVADGQRSLPVEYTGALPDAFKPGADLVVEGRLGASGVFEATTVLAKCPSKYQPADNAG